MRKHVSSVAVGKTANIASKYTDFSVFLRKLSTLYGQISENTEEVSAHKGVASITMNDRR